MHPQRQQSPGGDVQQSLDISEDMSLEGVFSLQEEEKKEKEEVWSMPWTRMRASARNSINSVARPRRNSQNGATGIAHAQPETYQQTEARVFVDAAAMKEKVRQNLTVRKVIVSDYYKDTGLFQKIARATPFENMTLGVIAFNAIWIAIDTDHNDAEMLLEAHLTFQIAEHFFCAFFSFEWISRFMSFRRKRNCCKDAWFIFDSMLVLTMVLETWALNFLAMLQSGGSGGGMGNASILRIARLLRLSRMARMARLLRAMPELMVLIKGMLAATRSVFFTLCLLVLIMYIFAIAFTQLCAGTHIGRMYFPGVGQSMYTLLVYGALLDDVGNFANQLGAESMVIAAIFFAFSLLAALTVMNMLIGVLCEVVSAVAATEKEEMLVGYVNGKLRHVVDMIDSDGDMQISKKEFVTILENVEAARALQEVGVDVIGLIDFAEFIFQDETAMISQGEGAEDDERSLSFGDFMEVILQLRGTNNSTVKDVVDLRKFVRRALIQTNQQLADIKKLLSDGRLSSNVDNCSNMATMDAQCSMLSMGAQKSRNSDNTLSVTFQDFGGSGYSDDTPVPPGSNGNNVDEVIVPSLEVSEESPKCDFEGIEAGFSPVPPLPTPPASLLHHRVIENERLLWGDRDEDAIALKGQWLPINEAKATNDIGGRPMPSAPGSRSPFQRHADHPTKDSQERHAGMWCNGKPSQDRSDSNQWSDCSQPVAPILLEELRAQMERLGKVLKAGQDEFDKMREVLDRDAVRLTL